MEVQSGDHYDPAQVTSAVSVVDGQKQPLALIVETPYSADPILPASHTTSRDPDGASPAKDLAPPHSSEPHASLTYPPSESAPSTPPEAEAKAEEAGGGGTKKPEAGGPGSEKVKIHLMAVGNAPILKKNKFAIEADKRWVF